MTFKAIYDRTDMVHAWARANPKEKEQITGFVQVTHACYYHLAYVTHHDTGRQILTAAQVVDPRLGLPFSDFAKLIGLKENTSGKSKDVSKHHGDSLQAHRKGKVSVDTTRARPGGRQPVLQGYDKGSKDKDRSVVHPVILPITSGGSRRKK